MIDDLIFLRDYTGNDTFDEKDRGWWVFMKESDDCNMILFTGIHRRETAEALKDRIDLAINRHIEKLLLANIDPVGDE